MPAAGVVGHHDRSAGADGTAVEHGDECAVIALDPHVVEAGTPLRPAFLGRRGQHRAAGGPGLRKSMLAAAERAVWLWLPDVNAIAVSASVNVMPP